MNKKLIIINGPQFGYHTDTYYYCKYLKDDFDITYISWDQRHPKMFLDKINIIYVSRNSNFIIRSVRFLKTVINEVKTQDRPLIFIRYFKVISLTTRFLLLRHKMVLDIRSGNISEGFFKRKFYDYLMKFESLFFKKVTIISGSLAEKLNIRHKAHILPLGADVISQTDKNFEELNLLYVGTLHMRNIDQTIKGFERFYKEFKGKIRIKYTVIGGGLNNEEERLEKLVADSSLHNVINIAGQIPHDQLRCYFDDHNIGVSYIPLTDYYDVQPPTKTVEYLLSGMPVIATRTTENRIIINPENGVLVGDTVEDFYLGLKIIHEKINSFDSKFIRHSSMDYAWKNIILKNVKIYLENI